MCVLISGNAVPYTTPITFTFEETSLKREGIIIIRENKTKPNKGEKKRGRKEGKRRHDDAEDLEFLFFRGLEQDKKTN